MYKLIDRQGTGAMENRRFKTKKAIIEALASYHDIDFTGCVNDKGKDIEVSIYDFLKQFKTTKEKLNYLLDYGEWYFKKITKRTKK